MVATMAPEKKPSRKGRPKGRLPTKAIQVRAPLDLADALDALAKDSHRTRNQELILAIENHLRQSGRMPVRKKDAQ